MLWQGLGHKGAQNQEYGWVGRDLKGHLFPALCHGQSTQGCCIVPQGLALLTLCCSSSSLQPQKRTL